MRTERVVMARVGRLGDEVMVSVANDGLLYSCRLFRLIVQHPAIK